MKAAGGKSHIRSFWPAILIVGLLLIGAAYYFFDPASSGFAPKCPVYTVSGFLCPGCGSQRMLHSLLHGDLRAAWEYNPFLLLAMPVIALYIFSAATRRRFPTLYARLNSLPAIGLICAAIVLWTILRNIP